MQKFADKPETHRERPGKRLDVPEAPRKLGEEGGDKQITPPVADGDDKAVQIEPKKEGKVWKLLKEKEEAYAKLEKEHAEIKTRLVDPEKEKQYTEKLTAAEKRQQELLGELQFYNYEKYNEDFKSKYDDPYKAAWHNAVEEITQLPVTLEDGTTRAGTASDLSKLIDLPPVDRREMAERMFGKYADDVIREAKEARRLFDARNRHLDEARKTLGTKEKERIEQYQNQHKTMAAQADESWKEAETQAMSHEKYGKYFTPIEGDQEGNQRLAKGKALAQRAFSENPFDPRLTPSDRGTIVKRQNAVCNRAAAFGRLVSWNAKLEGEVAELKKQLAEYNGGEPGAGDGRASDTEPPMKASERSASDLQKLAR